MSHIERDPVPRLTYIIRSRNGLYAHTTPAKPTEFAGTVRRELTKLKATGLIDNDELAYLRRKFSDHIHDFRDALQHYCDIEFIHKYGEDLFNSQRRRPSEYRIHGASQLKPKRDEDDIDPREAVSAAAMRRREKKRLAKEKGL